MICILKRPIEFLTKNLSFNLFLCGIFQRLKSGKLSSKTNLANASLQNGLIWLVFLRYIHKLKNE